MRGAYRCYSSFPRKRGSGGTQAPDLRLAANE